MAESTIRRVIDELAAKTEIEAKKVVKPSKAKTGRKNATSSSRKRKVRTP
jgi:hypothetical protein